MNTVILTWSHTFDALSAVSGTIELDENIRFSPGQRLSVRLIKASISTNIPNVYSVGTAFNNGLIKLSRNADDPTPAWTSVQLPDGVYTSLYIQAALNTAVGSWWTDPSDPGIVVSYNTATQLSYINLDSTKLVAPGTQLGIDLSASLIYEILGYNDVANKVFIVDGLHGADSHAHYDWTGNNISVVLDGFGPLTIRNGSRSNEICTIPMSASVITNEYVYPSNGITTPIIPLSNPPLNISGYQVSMYGTRLQASGTPYRIYVLEGSATLEIQLSWQ